MRYTRHGHPKPPSVSSIPSVHLCFGTPNPSPYLLLYRHLKRQGGLVGGTVAQLTELIVTPVPYDADRRGRHTVVRSGVEAFAYHPAKALGLLLPKLRRA